MQIEDVKISDQKEGRVWEGWGVSLCWWANVVGGYPEPNRSQITDLIFGQKPGELGLNIVRYNIGGGENPTHHHLQPRALMQGFLSPDGTYSWNADANQRWVLQRAKQLGANRFEAFSNSPPYFMTIDGCASGAPDGGANLKPHQYDAFANYLATVVKHFQTDWGIKFDSLEPMNESGTTWWREFGRQEGCGFPPGQVQTNLVLSCAAALRNLHLQTRLAVNDESSNTQVVGSFHALTSEARDDVFRLNSHSYAGNSMSLLDETATDYKKQLWISEYGDGDATGMRLSGRILKDVKLAHPSAWVYWQALDQTGSGWGFMDVDLNHKKLNFVINKKYFVMENYTRFIRPGAQFYKVESPNVLAATSKGKLILVVTAQVAQRLELDVSQWQIKGKQYDAYQTSPSASMQNLEDHVVKNGKIELDLPKDSVTTFVLKQKK